MKILYVCPFAHYSGHHPHAAFVEPDILKRNGHDVTLLTFCGIINLADAKVRHEVVLSHTSRLFGVLTELRSKMLTRWILMAFEILYTLIKAIKIYRAGRYDVIHLRDAEPLPFIMHLVSLPFKNLKWAVSVTASIVYKPAFDYKDIAKRPFIWLYCVALYGVNSKIWKYIYKLNLKRNRVILMPQNQDGYNKYSMYMDGVFADNVVCVPWGIDGSYIKIPKDEARQRLGLPLDKLLLLSFGAPHSGKSIVTIFKALSLIGKNTYLVHAGTHSYSLGENPVQLAKEYCTDGRAKLFNYFVPEDMKPYYFNSADAIVLSYTKAFASTSSMLWEAAKYRLPVIASDANILGQDVREYNLGLLFKAENAASLASAINTYGNLSNVDLEDIKKGCDRFLNRYSESEWVKNCNLVYQRLMANEVE